MYDLADDIIAVIFSYFNISDAVVLRAVSKSSAKLVTNYPWNDTRTVVQNVKLWRECFPLAISANISPYVIDMELSYLSCCKQITDQGLTYCHQITDNGLLSLKGKMLFYIRNNLYNKPYIYQTPQ